MKATAKSHAVYIFKQRRKGTIGPMAWKAGHEIPSAWSSYPAWNFLSRKTPVTLPFQHSFDLFPCLGFCSTFNPSVESLLGPKLHSWGSGREEQGSASVKAARLSPAGFKALAGGHQAGWAARLLSAIAALPGSRNDPRDPQHHTEVQDLHAVALCSSHLGAAARFAVGVSAMPMRGQFKPQWNRPRGLDQVWLALKHPAVWCDMAFYLLGLGGEAFCAFSF